MNALDNPQRLQEVYCEACRLVDGLLNLDDTPSRPLDAVARQTLERAILLFTSVVDSCPSHWPSMWLMGKAAQRLGDGERSFNYLRLAAHYKPDHKDVLREATIAALEIGRPKDAIVFATRATALTPDDAGLKANLSLALLFAENPTGAMAVAEQSRAIDSSDQITNRIIEVIEDVLRGARPCPHHVRELFGAKAGG